MSAVDATQVVPFCWTGANRYQDRLAASIQLRMLVDSLLELNPDLQVVIVGHSHGGNVGLYAGSLGTANQRAWFDRVSLIALSTPFVVAEPRRFPRLAIAGFLLGPLFVILAFGVAGAVAAELNISWLQYERLGAEVYTAASLLPFSFLLLSAASTFHFENRICSYAFLVVLSVFFLRVAVYPHPLPPFAKLGLSVVAGGWLLSLIPRFERTIYSTGILPIRLLWSRTAGKDLCDLLSPSVPAHFRVDVIRSPGDEASGILAVAAAVSWLSSRVLAIVDGRIFKFGIAAWLVLVSVGPFLVAVVPSGQLAASFTLWLAGAVLVGLAGLLLIVPLGMASILIVSPAFGGDGVFLFWQAALSAEAAPVGRVTVHTVATNSTSGLKHGSHSNPSVFEIVRSLVGG